MPNTLAGFAPRADSEVSVEDLFSLGGEGPAGLPRTEQVTLLSCGGQPAGMVSPCSLAEVDRRLVASVPSPLPWCLPTADAAVVSAGRFGKAGVRLFHGDCDLGSRILVAGCDPGISVLARHVRRAGVELVVAQQQ